MEYVEIVDENGNCTGQVLDIEKAHEQSLLHPAVIIFIVNDQNQVLLGKRSTAEKIDGGKWGLIGGHVSAGETKKQAAAREIKEEIGLEVDEKNLIYLHQKEVNYDQNNAHVIYFYYLKTNLDITKCKLELKEISAVKWFEIDDVIEAITNKKQDIIAKLDRVFLFKMIKNL